jgi:hypothetical protein
LFDQHDSSTLVLAFDKLLQNEDPDFLKSHEMTLLKVKSLMEIYRTDPKLRSSPSKAKLIILERSGGLFYSPRAYISLIEKGLSKKLLIFTNRKLLRSHPPQRFIGVGYRDKGSSRKDPIDASPSWQEVAVSPGSRLMAKENVLSKYYRTPPWAISKELREEYREAIKF